jgi:hypothetical protein
MQDKKDNIKTMAKQDIVKYQIKKGEVRNPNGRPKKYVTLLKESGYKLSEVNDTIMVLMSMTLVQVEQIIENEESTMLERTIAAAMVTSLKRGSLYSIETLLSRLYGKPRETIDANIENKTINLTMILD